MKILDKWQANNLDSDARGISASRRTDIPALFGDWFENRIEAGYVEYIPAGPPRRIQASREAKKITHFIFWSRNPAPFLPVVRKLKQNNYPQLFNITITGRAPSPLEPHPPPAKDVINTVDKLTGIIPAEAILWRFDPVILTEKYPPEFHSSKFYELCSELARMVDRIAVSFTYFYSRQTLPAFKKYQEKTDDVLLESNLDLKVDLVRDFQATAEHFDLEVTLCCCPRLVKETDLGATGCNSWKWATRIYPELQETTPLEKSPTREGCGCSREVDIGVYNTCPPRVQLLLRLHGLLPGYEAPQKP